MTIIVTKNGKEAQKLEKSNFANENEVQKYIHENPESLPLYEVKNDIQLFILKREFSTTSGPADAIGIDRDGDLYIIETKLYKNPDKRTVLAQVLDYGAAIWKNTDFNSFMNVVEEEIRDRFEGLSFDEKLNEFFDLEGDELENIKENLQNNLDKGIFKFVVLMDKIEDRLKDLIIFMNQNTSFDIYGVELDLYKFNDNEIIIPRLFGGEVKKEIKTQSKYKKDIYTEGYHLKNVSENIKEFYNELWELAYQKNNKLEKNIKQEFIAFKLNKINLPEKVVYRRDTNIFGTSFNNNSFYLSGPRGSNITKRIKDLNNSLNFNLEPTFSTNSDKKIDYGRVKIKIENEKDFKIAKAIIEYYLDNLEEELNKRNKDYYNN